MKQEGQKMGNKRGEPLGKLPTTEQEGELRQSPASLLHLEDGLDSSAAGAGGRGAGEGSQGAAGGEDPRVRRGPADYSGRRTPDQHSA